MKKIFILVYLIIYSICSNGQVAGYQGKRFLLNYHINFFPALRSPNANLEKGLTNFNYRNYLGLEYVVSNSGSVGIQYGFFKTASDEALMWGKNPVYDYDLYHSENPSYYYYYSSPYLSYGDYHSEIRAKSFGAYYKIFNSKRKGFIAPIGNYNRFGFQFVVAESKFIKTNVRYLKNKTDYEYSINKVFITYGLGKNFMLYKNLMGKIGAEFAFSIPSTSRSNKDFIAQRLNRMYAINLEAGLSYILF